MESVLSRHTGKPSEDNEITRPLDNSSELTRPLDNSSKLTRPLDNSSELTRPLDNSSELTRSLDKSSELTHSLDSSGEITRSLDNTSHDAKTIDESTLDYPEQPVQQLHNACCDDSLDNPEQPVCFDYPEQPVRPLDNECCGNGCRVCVFDLYELDIKRWKMKCDKIKSKSSLYPIEEQLSIYEYKSFKISLITHLTDDLIYYQFDIPNGERLPIKAGQHLFTRCYYDDGACVVRPYTPFTEVNQLYSFGVYIKLYYDGIISKCIKSQWTLGNYVDWRGPFGDYVYAECKKEGATLLMVAGGTGVTPMLSIISDILSNEDDMTTIHLVYSTKTSRDIIAYHVLREWNSYWNFKVCYCLTDNEPMENQLKYGDVMKLSRIDELVLHDVLPVSRDNKHLEALVCGSDEFNQSISKLIHSTYGIEQQQIYCF